MSFVRRSLVPARRFCSAVRIRSVAGGAQGGRAVPASGRPAAGRGVGRITSAKCASARASNASVLANCPVARAKSRACRGLTTTTGRPAVAKAPWRRTLQAAGGFQHNQGGLEGLQPFHERRNPTRHRSGRPSAPQRGAGQCPTGLWPHQYPQSMARHHEELLSARPCRYGLNGTRQLYGLGESRT